MSDEERARPPRKKRPRREAASEEAPPIDEAPRDPEASAPREAAGDEGDPPRDPNETLGESFRAYRAGLRVREIPVRVLEKRTPSINLMKRVPNVLKSLAKLTWAIRIKG